MSRWQFLAAQFGVAGPIVFGTLLVLFAYFGSRNLNGDDRAMLAFAVPPLRHHPGERHLFRRRQRQLGGRGADLGVHRHVRRSGARQACGARSPSALPSALSRRPRCSSAIAVADKLTIPLLGENADIYQRVAGVG